jgi:serine-type D-Ala-D-Ala carboxypeptidase/endopeptidase (penicillin-binding protein 4)
MNLLRFTTTCTMSLVVFFCYFLSATSILANEILPIGVKKALHSSKIPESALGFNVISIGKLHPQPNQHSWNAQFPMNPASTMKLLTTVAALDILGPQYRWKTNFYTTGLIEQGILNGNLIIQGFGDPKLVPEQLSVISQNLKQLDLQEIQGNLILDRSVYASSIKQSAPQDGESSRTYNVIPDPLLYAFQTLSFRIFNNNGQFDVTYTPRLARLRIINQIQEIKGACGDWTKNLKIEIRKINDEEWNAIFVGKLSINCPDIAWNSVSIDSNNFLKQGILASFEDSGIVWKNHPQIIESEVPSNAKLLLSHQGTSLTDAVKDINKYSNNVMARQVLLTVGLEKGNRPTSTTDSIRIVKDWLRRSKLNFPELVVENGSGLSNVERISPQSMTSLLNFAVSTKNNEIFINSLPIAGVDGTMKNRLLDRLKKLWSANSPETIFTPDLSLPNGLQKTGAYMKTGTLQTVRAVSGYVVSKTGKVYAVSSMVNHQNASMGGTAINDALLHWVLDDCRSDY